MNSKIERLIEEAEAELAAVRAAHCGTCAGQRVQVVIGDDTPLPISPCPECGRFIHIVHIVRDNDPSDMTA